MMTDSFPKPEKLIYKHEKGLPENYPDEGLIWKNFKGGDKIAYQWIYNTYFDLLFRYGKKINSERDQVKDCIHDLFVEMWKNKENLGEPVSVKNYLIKSIRRKLYRISLKNKTIFKSDNYEASNFGFESSHESGLIERQAQEEIQEKLLNALNRLSKRQKEAICLIYYDNLSYQEVAEIMSLKIRTVYNIVFSAIQVLKKEVPYFSSISVVLSSILCNSIHPVFYYSDKSL